MDEGQSEDQPAGFLECANFVRGTVVLAFALQKGCNGSNASTGVRATADSITHPRMLVRL